MITFIFLILGNIYLEQDLSKYSSIQLFYMWILTIYCMFLDIGIMRKLWIK